MGRASKVKKYVRRVGSSQQEWKTHNMREAAQQREQRIVEEYEIANRAYQELQDKKKVISGGRRHQSMCLRRNKQSSPNQTENSFYCNSLTEIARRIHKGIRQHGQPVREYLEMRSHTPNRVIGVSKVLSH